MDIPSFYNKISSSSHSLLRSDSTPEVHYKSGSAPCGDKASSRCARISRLTLIGVTIMCCALLACNIWTTMRLFQLQSQFNILKYHYANHIIDPNEFSNDGAHNSINTIDVDDSTVSIQLQHDLSDEYISTTASYRYLAPSVQSSAQSNTTSSEVSSTSSKVSSTSSEVSSTSSEVSSTSPLAHEHEIYNMNSSIAVKSKSRVRRSGPVEPDVVGTAAPEARRNRGSKKKGAQLFHLEVDSQTYRMEIEKPGQILNIWTPRRDPAIDFGSYQNNGVFKIRKRGLYFVYSQMTYYDNSGRWCHAIRRNSDIIAKCLASEWGMSIDPGTERYVPTVHNCFTSTAVYLRNNDELSVISLYGKRTVHQGKDMTYWGIVKLG